MSDTTYARARSIFVEVCDLGTAQRRAILSERCGDDGELLAEVRSLLRYHGSGCPELDLPVTGVPSPGLVAGVLRAQEELPAPARIGRYRIVRTIAAGGMGVVYEAESDELHRRVALKTILPGVASPTLLRRFQLEEEVLARLSHPGIAQIYETGTFDDGRGLQPYFAMEFVDGVSLTEFARREELDLRARLALLARVCDAVHHAHQKGVVHRDLKPDNILVQRSQSDGGGRVKILDFGVARALDSDLGLTTAHEGLAPLVGTLAYMAPEQLEADVDEVDTLSDVYTLGAVLYELVCGRPAHDVSGLALPAAVRHVTEVEPRRPRAVVKGLPAEIEAVLLMALAKDRLRRYSSAAALASDLRRFLDYQPVDARPATSWYLVKTFARRHRVAAFGLTGTVVALALGLCAATYFAVQAADRSALATARELEARRAAYSASLAAATLAIDAGDPVTARRQLVATSVRERNWEWCHLQARLDRVLAEVAVDDGVAAPGRIAFPPDGRALLAVVRDHGLEVVDLVSGVQECVLPIEEEVARLTLSPDGRHVALVGRDSGHLEVWSLASGAREVRVELPPAPTTDLRFDPSGEVLAVVTEDFVTVLDVESGQLRQRLPLAVGPVGIGLAPGGALLALTSSVGVQLVDLETASVLESWPISPSEIMSALTIDPGGRELAFGTPFGDRPVRRMGLATLDELPSLVGLAGQVGAVAFAARGKEVLASDGDTIAVWEAATGKLRRRVAIGPLRPVTAIAGNADSSLALLLAEDRALLVDLEGAPARILAHDSYVYHVAFSPDGSLVASITGDHEMRWWDAHTGDPLLVRDTVPRGQGLAFSADGSVLATTAAAWNVGTGLRLRDPVQGTLDYLARVRGNARTSPWGFGGQDRATSPGGNFELAATESGEVVVTRRRDGAELLRLAGHQGQVHAVAASPDETLLASGGADGTICLWSAVTGERLAVAKGHDADVLTLDFSPDGARLASGSTDRSVRLWETESLQAVGDLRGHTAYIHSVIFSPDGTQLASGSGDGTVRLWDALPDRARRALARAQAAEREAQRVLVDALLEAHPDPDLVAEQLRSAADLSGDARRAALRVLLARSAGRDIELAVDALPEDGVIVRYDAGAAAPGRTPASPELRTAGAWSGLGREGRPVVDDLGWCAWHAEDASTRSRGTVFRRVLSDRESATARARGWTLRVRLRVLEHEEPATVFYFDDGPGRWSWWPVLDDQGDLVLMEDTRTGMRERRVTSDGSGTGAYHLIEVCYDPRRQRASLRVDGRLVADDVEGVEKTRLEGSSERHYGYGMSFEEVYFGLGSTPGTGSANFNLVELELAR